MVTACYGQPTSNLHLRPSRRVGIHKSLSLVKSDRFISTIDEQTDWPQLTFKLEQQFAFGAALTIADVPPRSVIAELDALGNQDEVIDPAEFESLRLQPPDFTVQIDRAAETATAEASPIADRATQAGLIRASSARAPAAQTFAELDRDEDGALDQQEFALASLAGSTFEVVDRDMNRRIEESEFDFALEIAEMLSGAFLTARLSRSANPLFEVLDQNADNRLDRREIAAAADSIGALIPTQADSLTQDQLTAAISIKFTPGLISRTLQQPSAPPNDARPTQGPAWFESMDLDGSGQLDETEFLGTPNQFTTLDQNNDHLISRQEASAATPGTSG